MLTQVASLLAVPSAPVLYSRRHFLAGIGALSATRVVDARARDEPISLAGWKLQIPGPREIKALEGYRDRFFEVIEGGRLRFWIDASLEGPTASARYVRCELRHLTGWPVIGAKKQLFARLRVQSKLSPAQVTVLQIHAEGPASLPLVRIALVDGRLTAWVKSDASGERTERITLGSLPGSASFSLSVLVEAGLLSICYEQNTPVVRDVRFWNRPCYFKAGLYPQARLGEATAVFEQLQVMT
jgi:hypothetical protein